MSHVIKFQPRQAVKPHNKVNKAPFSVSDLVDGALSFDSSKESFSTQIDNLSEYVQIGDTRKPLNVPVCGESDWTNQELASLYRINRLLNMAELSIEADRGITDEGDPWFVFLDPGGEVFVHLCRIDATYMIDSPSQSSVVAGTSLDNLVEAFIQQTQKFEAEKRDVQANVVRLGGQRSGKIVAHPGAVLAALIWSIYLSSDKQGSSILSEEGSISVPMISTENDLPIIAADGIFTDETIARYLAKQDATLLENAHFASESDLKHSDKTATSMISLNHVAIGLSALAVSYGLDVFINKGPASSTKTTSQNLSGTVDIDAQQALAIKLLDATGIDWTSLQKFSENTVELFGSIVASDTFDHIPIELDTVNAGIHNIKKAEWVPTSSEESKKATDLSSVLNANFVPDMEANKSQSQENAAMVMVETSQINNLSDPASIPLRDLLAHLSDTALLSFETLSEGVSALLTTSDEARIGDLAVELTADAALDFLNDPIYILTDENNDIIDVIEQQYDSYNGDVRELITFLLAKDDNIQVFSYATELVLIDSAVFNQDSSLVYAKSWSLSDGSVISTIGLKVDFEAFDLIV